MRRIVGPVVIIPRGWLPVVHAGRLTRDCRRHLRAPEKSELSAPQRTLAVVPIRFCAVIARANVA
ncbi:hypothetical protein OG871_39000 [Kitasatospora sp. NBC_00374]|uniref:hypothetical protein n=1 Tax=Kitasatospora sp. NBC_00374 TaxID=2975964 RepID=UPI0030E0A6D1